MVLALVMPLVLDLVRPPQDLETDDEEPPGAGLMESGVWNDDGVWDDSENWSDG